MEKQKRTLSLVTRLVGGIAFATVFALNVLLYVKADSKGVSLLTLKAHAVEYCGYICPTPNCPQGWQPVPGGCTVHGLTLVPKECDQPPGDPGEDEEEEEEVGNAYEREVVTAVAVTSVDCYVASVGAEGTYRTQFCDDITCEGTGSVTCIAGMVPPPQCTWSSCQ